MFFGGNIDKISDHHIMVTWGVSIARMSTVIINACLNHRL